MPWRIVPILFALILPIYGQKKGTESTSHKSNTTTQPKAPAPSGSSIVNTINQDTAHQQDNGAKDHSKSYLSRLFSPENLPNIALFLVGVAGIVIAILTLRKIRSQAELMTRQAEIMERQEMLMQAPFDQWVEPMNWHAFPPNGLKMRITVELVNPTPFPVTLIDGVIMIQNHDNWVKSGLGDKAFISPRVPTTFELKVPLTGEQSKSDSLSFPITGIFAHYHRISGKRVTQKLMGRLDCGYWGGRGWQTSYEPFVHPNPEAQDPDQAENAKPN